MSSTHLRQFPAFRIPQLTTDPPFVTRISGLAGSHQHETKRGELRRVDVLDVVEERVNGVPPRLAHSTDTDTVRGWGWAAVAVEEGAEADTDFREQLEETHDE